MASKVKFNSKSINRKNQEAVFKGLTILTFSFQKRLISTLSKPGTGVKKSGDKYPPSVSPNPPAVQTGRLRNSWKAGVKRKTKKRGNPMVIFNQGSGFGKAVKYAAILEKGGSKTFLKRRPFIKPTLHFFRGKRASTIFSSVFFKELKKLDKAGPHG